MSPLNIGVSSLVLNDRVASIMVFFDLLRSKEVCYRVAGASTQTGKLFFLSSILITSDQNIDCDLTVVVGDISTSIDSLLNISVIGNSSVHEYPLLELNRRKYTWHSSRRHHGHVKLIKFCIHFVIENNLSRFYVYCADRNHSLKAS